MMFEPRICPDCGARLAPDLPDGACPECALREALRLEIANTQRGTALPDAAPTLDAALSRARLAEMLYDEREFAETESFQREEAALRRKCMGSGSPVEPALLSNFVDAMSRWVRTLLEAGRYEQAEPAAREWLGIGEKELPDDWQTFNARSLLGGSLLGQKKFAQAEPLLLEGYRGMNQRLDRIPSEYQSRIKESLERIVRLYENMGRPILATEWKQKIVEFKTGSVRSVTGSDLAETQARKGFKS